MSSKRRKATGYRSPKLEPIQHTLLTSEPELESGSEQATTPREYRRVEEEAWKAEEDIALFEALARFKPVELKNVLKENHFTIEQIWARLHGLYNLEQLDASQNAYEEFKEDMDGNPLFFSLPEDEFGTLMEARLAENLEKEKEAAMVKKKTDGRKRGASPATPQPSHKKRR